MSSDEVMPHSRVCSSHFPAGDATSAELRKMLSNSKEEECSKGSESKKKRC